MFQPHHRRLVHQTRPWAKCEENKISRSISAESVYGVTFIKPYRSIATTTTRLLLCFKSAGVPELRRPHLRPERWSHSSWSASTRPLTCVSRTHTDTPDFWINPPAELPHAAGWGWVTRRWINKLNSACLRACSFNVRDGPSGCSEVKGEVYKRVCRGREELCKTSESGGKVAPRFSVKLVFEVECSLHAACCCSTFSRAPEVWAVWAHLVLRMVAARVDDVQGPLTKVIWG